MAHTDVLTGGNRVKTTVAKEISWLLISMAWNMTCWCLEERMGFHMMYTSCSLKVIWRRYSRFLCSCINHQTILVFLTGSSMMGRSSERVKCNKCVFSIEIIWGFLYTFHCLVSFSVKNECVNSILPILTRYKSTKEAGDLLCISFTSLTEYLWLLRAACECLASFGSRAVLYLAAAVSDFYIPSNEMVSK